MEAYDTLTQAIDALKTQGYDLDFNLEQNCLECSKGEHSLMAQDFEIDKSFRFDNDEDPADQTVLYAISSPINKVKGILVNAVGIYSDDRSSEIIAKLSQH